MWCSGGFPAISTSVPWFSLRIRLPAPRYTDGFTIATATTTTKLPLSSSAFSASRSCSATGFGYFRAFNGSDGGSVAITPLLQDAGATALVMAGAYSLVLAFDVLTERNLIEQKLSRKTVHVLSGLLFMLSWPIFSSSVEARIFAAMVPLVNCLRLIYYGLSLATNEGLTKSVTREGNPEELLRGPLYYVLVLMFCVLVYWRESPVGVVSLAMMSGGDGFADIMGRRFGAVKLPYNGQKSWVGSICMFVSGFLISTMMLYYFTALGYIHLDWGKVLEKVALVSLTATVVESLPITDILDDNISVPLCSMLAASVLFG